MLILLNPIEQSQVIVKKLGTNTMIQIHKITNIMVVAIDMTKTISTTCMLSTLYVSHTS